MQSNQRSLMVSLLVALLLWGSPAARPALGQEQASDSTARLTIAPPEAGLYLGQHTSGPGEDIATFERSVGKKVALWSPYQVMYGQEEVAERDLRFDVAAAERAWAEGYIVFAGAYEATPLHRPFTVDDLLRGKYDRDLRELAKQFRMFGKPMLFQTAREPNSVLSSHMGGFGPDGDKGIEWALDTGRGFRDFVPSRFPNPGLYDGLGDDAVCDGIERLAAAQRYYFDFFVRREGLDFLTFATMGWAVPLWARDYARGSLESACASFADFYKGLEGYADWVTINWGVSVDDGAAEPRPSYFVGRLDSVMKTVRRVARAKPVMIMELGFCGEPRLRPERIRAALTTIVLDYPEIRGIGVWGSSYGGGSFIDCLIKPGSSDAAAFKEVMAQHPGYFRSCVRFSDGSGMPNCQEDSQSSPNAATRFH